MVALPGIPETWDVTKGQVANYLYGQDEDYSIHYINIEETRSYIYICGPYYLSLLEAFNVRIGDTIKFNWNRLESLFNVSVTPSTRLGKPWRGFLGRFLIFSQNILFFFIFF